jgi:hypothetical protein
MTEEEESDAIPINKNPINIITKTKVKLPSTTSNHIIKRNKQLYPQHKLTKKKIIYKNKYYQKIIINNISKYNTSIGKVNSFILNNLINNNSNHLTSIFKDNFIFYYDKEFCKKFYIKKESIKRFPKFYLYYKNYFKFFLKPTLSDLFTCNIIRKNGNKQASYFYEKHNYNNRKDKNKNKNKEKDNNNSDIDSINIFTKSKKKEIDIFNNNSKNILGKENKNQSTILFSYDSLNNSKIKNNDFQNDSFISLSSIANLINQSKNMKSKNKPTTKEDFLQNKLKLLNLNDKAITQKTSTLMTSARSKKFDTLKERNNINFINNYNNNFFYFKCNNNNDNTFKTINNFNKETFGNYVHNEKEIECDIYFDCKIKKFKDSNSNNKMISSNLIKYNNKIIGKEIRSHLNNNNQKDILIVPKKHKNDFKKNNYINTNINVNPNNNVKTPIFTNENKNTIVYSHRYNNRYNSSKRAPLKIDYYKSTQIISNNKPYRLHSSASELKKPINVVEKMNQDFIINNNSENKAFNKFRDYCISSTEITKVKKKIPASRNVSCDLANSQNKNQKNSIVGKNIYFSVYGLNHLNNNDILYNNKLFFDYNKFYQEKNIPNMKMSADFERHNCYENTSERKGSCKTNLRSSSSIEFRKKKINKLIKELENMKLLRNEKNKNGQDKYAILEYKRKMKKNKKITI